MTFAVIPMYSVPQAEMAGVVPTESTGGRFTNSISLVSHTQWLSVSHTSSVIWCVPSDRQVTWPAAFASK